MHLKGANIPEMVHPAICVGHYMNLPGIYNLGKQCTRWDPHVSKSVHTAAKMCTPGAGCTLNFEHRRFKHNLLCFTNDPAQTIWEKVLLSFLEVSSLGTLFLKQSVLSVLQQSCSREAKFSREVEEK